MNFRPRSRTEVEIYLNDKGFAKEAVADTIARLEDLGYLNDREFARIWIEHRSRLNPKGAYVLKGNSVRKGSKKRLSGNCWKPLMSKSMESRSPETPPDETIEKRSLSKN
ncbi:MAG: RecX family transcriptional regulator [Desulfobacterales bacterium]